MGATETKPHPVDYLNVPGCTYCLPQIGSVGYTEAKAKEAGFDVLTGKFPFTASGKAAAIGDQTGFVKVVVDKKYGEVLGAHDVPEAGDRFYVLASERDARDIAAKSSRESTANFRLCTSCCSMARPTCSLSALPETAPNRRGEETLLTVSVRAIFLRLDEAGA